MGRLSNSTRDVAETAKNLYGSTVSHDQSAGPAFLQRCSSFFLQRNFLAAILIVLVTLQSGCGSGGYAGFGISNLSASVITLDAGQSMAVSANGSGNLPLRWALSGAACAGEACGTLSETTGTAVTYTAPASLGTPAQVSLNAAVAGTKSVRTVAINLNPAPAIAGNPPAATVGVAYSFTFTTTGGTTPSKLTLQSGTLPKGLTFDAATGRVLGTPTAVGASTFMLQLVDSSDVPYTVTATKTITVGAPSSASGLLVIDGMLPAGTVGTAYSAMLRAGGGPSPYAWQVAGGSLPAGLTLSATGVISGVPTAAGTSSFTAQVTDASSNTATGTFSITITVNPASLSLASGTLPNGTVGVAYTANLGVTGGTAPYTCALANGTLPAGLTLAPNCSVTGTPTVAGTATVIVRFTDAGNPAQSTTAPQTININGAALLTVSSPLAATVNHPYSGTVSVAGGTAPYTCTLSSGTLAAGLTLNADCTITGTPTAVGAQPISVQVTDSSSPARTSPGNVTVTVNPDTATLTLSTPPAATLNAPYTGTIPVSGGTAPYNCALASGTLPTGLTLQANCTVTGTPTAVGSTVVQVTATDSTSPTPVSGTGTVAITVQPALPVTLTGSTPNAVVDQPYTQTLAAAGGVAPYTYTLTSGTLPDGITLSSAGVVNGMPAKAGASSFTVTATDSQGTPQSASLPLVLLVTYAPTASDALLSGPYAFLFQGYDDVVAGVLAYKTATAGSILADGNGVITDGEQNSNHQLSNPAGNTVATSNVLGTYTIGTDRRGSLTLTSLNADGTVAATTTYAIALRAPVAPAANATAGSLIEFDGDQLTGTKGSGTLLAQTATALASGLNGSYAFGLSGETPCLPSCTIGIDAGPVATAGQFTAAANTITGGTADTNIARRTIPNSALSGSYTISDSYGRVDLSLVSAGVAGIPYPTHFAAYVVDSSHVMLLSTDKHAAYILQAGTATLQTQASFSNASLSAGYVGWENSTVDPGLLGTTLQNTLNLSTAMIFQDKGNGDGTCTTNKIDFSGTSGVVSRLTGIVNAPTVTALLGSYQSTGNHSCTVAANGRAVLTYPAPGTLLSLTLQGLGLPLTPSPRVAYLTAPNQGYFLETAYAALGMLEAQTATTYSNADLSGTYVYGSVPASTLASINSSGVITADGAGNVTSTLDRNVGVGTINVLQLGITTPATYNVTDTAAGRFQLSTGEVLYKITPGRFALLRPELANTSPFVSLLF